MPRDRVPPELQHLTRWEDFARWYHEADIKENRDVMASVWRQAYDLAYYQREEIPRDLWPHDFIGNRLHQGKAVFTTDIGAWLNAMAQWSRLTLQPSGFRR